MVREKTSRKNTMAPFSEGTLGSRPLLSERQWILLVIVALGLALALLAAIRLFYHKPNVLLITIDTLRADRLSCYGHPAPTSPNIDAIARQGYLFERCYATSSWTLPSVMSIHTGLYPFHHGVEWVDNKLPADAPTLAEILKAEGYETGAVESSLFLQSLFGFGRGFDRYMEKPISDHRAISSPSLTERVIEWLQRHSNKPFFFWIHYLDPHYDYLYHPEAERFVRGIPPEALSKEYSIIELKNTRYSLSPEEYGYQNRLYDGEIFFMDRHVGRLVDFLKASGRWEDTLVIVTSDHGEMLGEHGALGHTESFYEEILRVPLIIKPPRVLRQGKRIEEVATIADVLPTIAGILGLPLDPAAFDGIALPPARQRRPEEDSSFRGNAGEGESSPLRPLWAQTNTPEVHFIARLGQLKFVFEPRTETKWVFDPEARPLEEQNLFEDRREQFAAFLQEARALPGQRAASQAERVEVTPGFLEQVEALGYIGSSTNTRK